MKIHNEWKREKKHLGGRRGFRNGKKQICETLYRKQETNAQKWKLKKIVIEITIIMTINNEIQAIETSFCCAKPKHVT